MSYTEKAGRLLRLMGWIILVVLIGVTIAVMIPFIVDNSQFEFGYGIIFIFIAVLIIPILYLRVGTAIKQNKKWAKITGVVIGFFSLINAPIGTLFGIALLYYLKKGWNEDIELAE